MFTKIFLANYPDSRDFGAARSAKDNQSTESGIVGRYYAPANDGRNLVHYVNARESARLKAEMAEIWAMFGQPDALRGGITWLRAQAKRPGTIRCIRAALPTMHSAFSFRTRAHGFPTDGMPTAKHCQRVADRFSLYRSSPNQA